MKIAIIGRSEILYETALNLHKIGHRVVCIITAKAAPEYTRTAADFKRLADQWEIPFGQGPYILDHLDIMKNSGADISVSINYTGVIPASVIDLFPHGILNAHGGDLPRYRGNACQAWALINGEEKIFNSLIVVNNNFDKIYEYKKRKLVPFGEFLPIENIFNKFGLKKITHGYGSFSKGEEQQLFNIYDFKILTLICYEIIFPELSKTIDEKNLIINISEDAWFGKSIGPYQHFSKAIYRAIENDVFVARAANKGISAFINNKGVIKKNLSPNETGAIEMSIPIIKNSSKKYKKDLIFFILLFTYVFIFVSNKKLNEQK